MVFGVNYIIYGITVTDEMWVAIREYAEISGFGPDEDEADWDEWVEELGITNLYQGDSFIGVEVWSSYGLSQNGPIPIHRDGTIYPISIELTPEIEAIVREKISLFESIFSHVDIPEIGLYWRYGTS